MNSNISEIYLILFNLNRIIYYFSELYIYFNNNIEFNY